jgi:hypothetical protein
MRRFLSLVLTVCLPLLGTGAARAAEETYPVSIGRALVTLPIPPGYVEPSRTVPPIRNLGERMTPPSNRLLAVFVSEQDESAARGGQQPGMERYFMAQTLRQTEDAPLTEQEFDQVKTMLRQQYQTLLTSVTSQAQGHIDNALRDIGQESGRMKIGEFKGLEVTDERAFSISLLAMTKLALQQGERTLEVPLAMSITTARVKDKLVYFYADSLLRGPEDLDWLRTVTRDWLPRLLAAN